VRITQHSPVADFGPNSVYLPVAALAMTLAQKAHLLAAIGIVLRHSGHSFVVGSGGASPPRTLAINAFIGRITKK
jgi:hypothetical protein